MNHRPRYTVLNLIWHSYVKSALVPILVIEVILLAAYFITNTYIRNENVRHLEETVKAELSSLSSQEAGLISSQLAAVTEHVQVLANVTLEALSGSGTIPDSEKRRFGFAPGGAWYTQSDNGGAAAFYSGVTPLGEKEREKAWRLSATDTTMRSIVTASPLVTQAYFNSHDSFNRIYPYFDTSTQYPNDMAIPEYNFYYEADAKHNPARKPVWTDVYIDPAGQGWMASAIAPVYRDDFLEGVVGLDILVKDLIRHLLDLQLPWNAYAMLLDRNGVIMALPRQGEADLGLQELTDHRYEEAIMQDTFKPDEFNVLKRSDTLELAKAIKSARPGLIQMVFADQPKLLAVHPITSTGWSLALVVGKEEIFREANRLQAHFKNIGYWMLAGLIGFYFLFFAALYWKAKKLSQFVALPLQKLAEMIEAIGRGSYRQQSHNFDVTEIQQTADGLVAMGEKLERSNRDLTALTKTLEDMNADLEQRVLERTAALARSNSQLEEEKQEQTRLYQKLKETQAQLLQTEKIASIGQLAAGVAHEINNPLTFISLNIATLKNYAAMLTALIEQMAGIIQGTGGEAELERQKAQHHYEVIAEDLPDLISESLSGINRVCTIVESLRKFAHSGNTRWQKVDLNSCVRSTLAIAVNEIKNKATLTQELDDLPPVYCIPSQISQVLINILLNAAQALAETGVIRIKTYTENSGVVLEVSDTGRGIPRDILPNIFDPFFTTKDVGQGTGLGLSISYGIVQAHKGTITVESEEGHGTRFKIWLPLDHEEG